MADDGLVAALARCQAKFPAIVKSHTNPAFKGSQYADVADVLAAVRPVLAAEGIALTQFTTITDEGAVVLVTSITWGPSSDAEMVQSHFPLQTQGLNAQGVGSLMTYHRRYQLCALLGVHPVGDDDDGNLAATAQTAPARRYERSVEGERGPLGALAQRVTAAPSHPEPIAQPEKPIAAMTMSEIIGYARENGIPLPSGSKAELIRHLEPLVRAQTGEEPFELEGAEPIEAKDDVTDKPFEPVVHDPPPEPGHAPPTPPGPPKKGFEPANPATGVKDELRLLKPDARASVRRGD